MSSRTLWILPIKLKMVNGLRKSVKIFEEINKYTDTYFDEVDFKAYMSEFVTAYSRGIEEKIEFQYKWISS